jgi:hypothetical protein
MFGAQFIAVGAGGTPRTSADGIAVFAASVSLLLSAQIIGDGIRSTHARDGGRAHRRVRYVAASFIPTVSA